MSNCGQVVQEGGTVCEHTHMHIYIYIYIYKPAPPYFKQEKLQNAVLLSSTPTIVYLLERGST